MGSFSVDWDAARGTSSGPLVPNYSQVIGLGQIVNQINTDPSVPESVRDFFNDTQAVKDDPQVGLAGGAIRLQLLNDPEMLVGLVLGDTEVGRRAVITGRGSLPADGKLGGDVEFSLLVGYIQGDPESAVEVPVTVRMSDTTDNATREDLASDVRVAVDACAPVGGSAGRYLDALV